MDSDSDTSDTSSTASNQVLGFLSNGSSFDFILTSCDNIKIEVHETNLRRGSCVFEDMLNCGSDTNRCVQLSETSQCLHLLLRFFYPIGSDLDGWSIFQEKPLDILLEVGVAAHKYQMALALAFISGILKDRFANSGLDIERAKTLYEYAYRVQDCILARTTVKYFFKSDPYKVRKFRGGGPAWKSLSALLLLRRGHVGYMLDQYRAHSFGDHRQTGCFKCRSCKGPHLSSMWTNAVNEHFLKTPSKPMKEIPKEMKTVKEIGCARCVVAYKKAMGLIEDQTWDNMCDVQM